MVDQLWDYHIIGVWPRKGVKVTAEALDWLRMSGQVELTLTEAGWARFKAGLAQLHLDVREAERKPHVDPIGLRFGE